jgi:hypothetical protein
MSLNQIVYVAMLWCTCDDGCDLAEDDGCDYSWRWLGTELGIAGVTKLEMVRYWAEDDGCDYSWRWLGTELGIAGVTKLEMVRYWAEDVGCD